MTLDTAGSEATAPTTSRSTDKNLLSGTTGA